MAQVRRARVEDAAGMAAVHVASWESTYEGLLPAAYIAERSLAARKAFWSDCLAEADPRVCIFVASGEDGEVCGFASGGPERTEFLGMAGELYSLYLLESAQGKGLGRRLVEAVLGALGDGPVSVWVLEANPAREFYKHLGGKYLKERRVAIGGEMLGKVAYVLGTPSKM